MALIALNLIYAFESIFTKYASQQPFMSLKYLGAILGAVLVLGLYAIGWQLILKHVELGKAYMFKGTSLIFVILLAFVLFGEQITLNNVVGAVVIIYGIVLFAKE